MRRKIFALLLALCLTAAAGAQAETVCTSFYPIYVFTLNLCKGVDDLTVYNLAAPGTGCLHDYQLQTGDMKALAKADLFVINGAGMESYLAHVYDAFPDLPVIDSATGIELMDDENNPIGTTVPDGVEANAHVWLSVPNAETMIRNICDGLTAQLPQYRELFEQNRDDYISRLDQVDAELREGIAELPHRDIVTFHEAFPYFAKEYGLNVAAVISREPGDALSPAELTQMVRTVQALNNPPLFVEPQYEDMAAEAISEETGAPIYVLDPVVTGPEDESALTIYEDTMRKNLQVLQEALQ